MFWFPSSRESVVVSGLNDPALMFVVPDARAGENGSGLEHGAPPGPEVIWNVEDGLTAGVPDHGVNDVCVVYAPHNAGVLSGARAVPKKCSSRSLNGSCGVFSNVVTSWPVTGSGVVCPASFTSTPAVGSSATRYSAISEPNGLSSGPAKFCGAARYTAPSSGSGSSGVLIVTVATFDASGHVGLLAFSRPICACEHACRPSAADGLSCTPAGSVTVVSFTSASASPAGFTVASWGTCRWTFNPVGVLPDVPSGCTSIDGLKSSLSQPDNGGKAEGSDTKLPGFSHEL